MIGLRCQGLPLVAGRRRRPASSCSRPGGSRRRKTPLGQNLCSQPAASYLSIHNTNHATVRHLFAWKEPGAVAPRVWRERAVGRLTHAAGSIHVTMRASLAAVPGKVTMAGAVTRCLTDRRAAELRISGQLYAGPVDAAGRSRADEAVGGVRAGVVHACDEQKQMSGAARGAQRARGRAGAKVSSAAIASDALPEWTAEISVSKTTARPQELAAVLATVGTIACRRGVASRAVARARLGMSATDGAAVSRP